MSAETTPEEDAELLDLVDEFVAAIKDVTPTQRLMVLGELIDQFPELSWTTPA